MLKKLQIISAKLSSTRQDVWTAEMLYKFVHGDLGDPEWEAYFQSYPSPYEALLILISNLYIEATKS